MICYASRTGTRRNLEVLRAYGWRLLVSRAGVWRTEGFERIAADNGAWADFQAGRPFDEDAFERFLEWLEKTIIPDWIVLPDIVAGGLQSLDLSLRYMNRCLAIAPRVLIAVQDGMTFDHLAPLVGPSVGIFLGGSTEWKEETMIRWGRWCAAPGNYQTTNSLDQPVGVRCDYHVARANTKRRIFAAIAAEARSFDGSSGSRYAVTIPMLTHWARHRDLLI